MFAIECTPWLSSNDLEIGCRLEDGDPQDQNGPHTAIFEELNNFNIRPEVRVTRKFQSQVSLYLFNQQDQTNGLVFSFLQGSGSSGASLSTP